MKSYKLTVFEHTGEKLLDESFQSENDDEAKKTGSELIQQKGFQDKTHRCTSPAGKLILFAR